MDNYSNKLPTNIILKTRYGKIKVLTPQNRHISHSVKLALSGFYDLTVIRFFLDELENWKK